MVVVVVVVLLLVLVLVLVLMLMLMAQVYIKKYTLASAGSSIERVLKYWLPISHPCKI